MSFYHEEKTEEYRYHYNAVDRLFIIERKWLPYNYEGWWWDQHKVYQGQRWCRVSSQASEEAALDAIEYLVKEDKGHVYIKANQPRPAKPPTGD